MINASNGPFWRTEYPTWARELGRSNCLSDRTFVNGIEFRLESKVPQVEDAYRSHWAMKAEEALESLDF